MIRILSCHCGERFVQDLNRMVIYYACDPCIDAGCTEFECFKPDLPTAAPSDGEIVECGAKVR